VSLDALREELAGLEFVHARELDREVREGAYHTGVASVVQVVGLRALAAAADNRFALTPE
jgi:hypothetical protein